MGSLHPGRHVLVSILGLVFSGCHDWTTTGAGDAVGDAIDTTDGDGTVDGPPDAPADSDDSADRADADDGGADVDDGGADVREDVGPEAVTTCGDGILDPGEDCERGQEVACVTRCGTRSVVHCPGDCRAPPPDTCPPPPEVCNGRDDDCSGAPDDPDGVCPGCVVVAPVEGHVYHFCEAQRWLDAGAICRDRGLHLVAIDDEWENEEVSSLAARLGPGRWWMGLNDREREGAWVWDGTMLPPRYTNWAVGQPDNSGEEDCGELLFEDDRWNDAPCEIRQPFVCEYP